MMLAFIECFIEISSKTRLTICTIISLIHSSGTTFTTEIEYNIYVCIQDLRRPKMIMQNETLFHVLSITKIIGFVKKTLKIFLK